MSVKQERRDFIGLAFGAVAAVGGALSLVAVKKTWDPLPSVKAGATSSFDLSPMQDGEMRQVVWRKQPIFILKKDPSMPPNDKRDVVVGDARLAAYRNGNPINKYFSAPVMRENLTPTE